MMLKLVRLAATALALLSVVATGAYASGSKTIVNNSGVTIGVRLFGRIGATPGGGSLPPVVAFIRPFQSANLQYGSDSNPYLNILEVKEASIGSNVFQSFATTQAGPPGTLDNLFNAYSTIVLSYQPATYSFKLTSHN